MNLDFLPDRPKKTQEVDTSFLPDQPMDTSFLPDQPEKEEKKAFLPSIFDPKSAGVGIGITPKIKAGVSKAIERVRAVPPGRRHPFTMGKGWFGMPQVQVQPEIVEEAKKIMPRQTERMAGLFGKGLVWAGQDVKEGTWVTYLKNLLPITNILKIGKYALWPESIQADYEKIIADPQPYKNPVIKRMAARVGDFMTKQGNIISDFWDEEAMRGWEAPSERSMRATLQSDPWMASTTAIGGAVPTLGTAMYITVMAGGNPWPGLAALGLMEGSSFYDEAMKKGSSHSKASHLAAAVTVGVSLLEYYPFNYIMRGGTGRLLPKMLLSSQLEGSEEVLQQIWTNALNIWGYDDARAWYDGTLISYVAGAGSGGLAGGISPGQMAAHNQLEVDFKALAQDVAARNPLQPGFINLSPDQQLNLLKEQVASIILERPGPVNEHLQEKAKKKGLLPKLEETKEDFEFEQAPIKLPLIKQPEIGPATLEARRGFGIVEITTPEGKKVELEHKPLPVERQRAAHDTAVRLVNEMNTEGVLTDKNDKKIKLELINQPLAVRQRLYDLIDDQLRQDASDETIKDTLKDFYMTQMRNFVYFAGNRFIDQDTTEIWSGLNRGFTTVDDYVYELKLANLSPKDIYYTALRNPFQPRVTEALKASVERIARKKGLIFEIETPEAVTDVVPQATLEKITESIVAEQIEAPKPVEVRVQLQVKDLSMSLLNNYRRQSNEAGPMNDTKVRVLVGPKQHLWQFVKNKLGVKKKAFAASALSSTGDILVHQDTVNRYWKLYQADKNFFKLPGVVQLPQGLTKEQFFQFAVEHEKVHKLTGLDGTKIDENFVNIIALERVGRADLASSIERSLPLPGRGKILKVTEPALGELAEPALPNPELFKFTGIDFLDHIRVKKETQTAQQVNDELAAVADDVAKLNALESTTHLPYSEGKDTLEISLNRQSIEIIRQYAEENNIPLNQFAYEALNFNQKRQLRKRIVEANADRVIPGEIILSAREVFKMGRELTKEDIENQLRRDAYDLANEYMENRRLTENIIKGNPILKRGYKTVEGRALPTDPNDPLLAPLRQVDEFFKKEIDQFNQAHPEALGFIEEAIATWNSRQKLLDYLGGMPQRSSGPIFDREAPNRPAQIYSTRLRMMLKVGDFLGVFNDQNWDSWEFVTKWVGAKNIEDWNVPKKVKGWNETARPDLTQKLFGVKNKQQYNTWMQNRLVDVCTVRMYEIIDNKGLKGAERTRAYNTISALMLRVLGESVIDGRNATGYMLSNIGVGGAHLSNAEAAAYVEEMTRFHKAVRGTAPSPADLTRWQLSRDTNSFSTLLDELDPRFRDLIMWYKNDIEFSLLKAQLEIGRWDNAAIYSRQQEGYGPRHSHFTEEQKKRSGFQRKLRAVEEAKRRIRTYSEFNKYSESAGMVVLNDFPRMVGRYVRDGLEALDQQRLLNYVKEMASPDAREGDPIIMKIVMYSQDLIGQSGIPDAAAAQAWLLKNRYAQMPDASGLADWSRNQFKIPYVHASAYDIIDRIMGQRKAGKGSAASIVLAINGMHKRCVMWTAAMYAVQMGSGGALHLTFSKGGPMKVWNQFIAPLMPFAKVRNIKGTGEAVAWALGVNEILRKGVIYGREILKGEQPYNYLQGRNYDPVKLAAFARHGLTGMNFSWVMDTMFDHMAQAEHPMNQAIGTKTKEFLMTKMGTDKYAFQYYIAPLIYETTSLFYDRFRAQGVDHDNAARLAVRFVDDISGMANASIYGNEGMALQMIFFARNFTWTFLRQLTGATYPIWQKAHHFRTGNISHWSNSLLHGEKTKADMDMLWKGYARHLALALSTRYMMLNLLQFGITMLFGDDEAKKKPWAFQNEDYRKLALRLPIKHNNRWVYLDPLMLREATQMWDIGPGSKQRGGRGTATWARNKLSWIVGATIAMLINRDMMGFPITERTKPLDRLSDRAEYFFDQAVPEWLRRGPGRKEPWTGLTELYGAKVRYGRRLERGYLVPEPPRIKKLREFEQRVRGDLKKIYRDIGGDPKRALQAVRDGTLTPDQYVSWLDNYYYPQTKQILRGAEYPWLEGYE